MGNRGYSNMKWSNQMKLMLSQLTVVHELWKVILQEALNLRNRGNLYKGWASVRILTGKILDTGHGSVIKGRQVSVLVLL